MQLIESLKKNPFVLAPMAGITDHAFRSFMKQQGAGVVVTELVSATGLEFNSKKTRDLMSFDASQKPIGIQLFGDNIEHVAKAAKVVEEMGADFVDMNFGCPVPKVVKKGAGSAMLKNLPYLAEMLRSTVAAVKIPVTIKIRTGWDANSRNADEVLKIAYDEGITWVAIHGRTRAQGYQGLADWDYIGEVKAKAKIPVIGNGDILTAKQACDYLKKYKLDGVMIGRGALKNPYIFKEAVALMNEDIQRPINKNFESLFDNLKEHLVSRCDEHISQIQLKKFASWFSTGYPGASQFRKNIYQSKSTDEIMDFVKNYFYSIRMDLQEDTSQSGHNGFLMGGHG